MKIHPFWDPYPVVQTELGRAAELIDDTIKIPDPEVQKAIREMLTESGGKMLRPAFCLLFAHYGREPLSEKIYALAASLEILHNATLIHDDIVDESALRRGSPTIKNRFGNRIAVYAGDYLFAACFKLLAKYASTLKSVEMNTDSMEKILIGEIGQNEERFRLHQTIGDYLKNIQGKTAELFALSCFLGAYENDAPETIGKSARKIGENIGMAFQIVDDLLDYQETAAQIGKPVLEDVRQGVYSLPLLYALDENPAALQPLLQKKEAITENEAAQIARIISTTTANERARTLAKKYTDLALAEIRKLPQTQTTTILLDILPKILTRNY